MSHCISVFVIKKDQAKIDLSKFVHVEAPQGFIILPDDKLWGLIESESENINPARGPEMIAEKISSGSVAYLTTDYFGGPGEQSAQLFNHEGKEIHDFREGSIDRVLATMGVIKENDMDEFDTIHLGRYRSNSDFSEPEEEEEDLFAEERKKNDFVRKNMTHFSGWCTSLYHYKGEDRWTHGSGRNEKFYSTDDLLTIYISQGNLEDQKKF